jgi:hypothetical protein
VRPREAAYRATSYEVDDGAHRFALRVGARSAALDALLAARGARAWAWLTAHNPGGLRAHPAANDAAQARLEAALAVAGHAFLRGASRSDAGDWPPEPSLLVPGLARADAVALARRFGQEAILAGVREGPVELVFCAAEPALDRR